LCGELVRLAEAAEPGTYERGVADGLLAVIHALGAVGDHTAGRASSALGLELETL